MRRYLYLLKLKFRAWMLQAEAEHVAELLTESEGRYKRLVHELAYTRRQIAMRESAEVLLRRTA